MHGFSTVDGFVEITECLAEMIKYVANEPSVGLFYVQQHAQNAIPNVINLKNNVAEKSRGTNLHTEDLEDSIVMVRSMKECGSLIADDMIKDIRKSLATLSTKQPRRGLIRNSSSSLHMGRYSSWGSAAWGDDASYAQQDTKRMSNYFSTVFKNAKEKASNFKWPQLESKELTLLHDEKLRSCPNPPHAVASSSTCPSVPDTEADEIPLSSQATDEHQVEGEEQQVDQSVPSHNLSLLSENYDYFKAEKEAKLEEWLGEAGDNLCNLKERK